MWDFNFDLLSFLVLLLWLFKFFNIYSVKCFFVNLILFVYILIIGDGYYLIIGLRV